MHYMKNEETEICLGMCYRPERVLTDIFSLEATHKNASDGIYLSALGSGFYLEEISRTISVISMQCRQRVFSYLLTIKDQLGEAQYLALEKSERLSLLQKQYPIADEAIQSVCGYQVSKDGSLKDVSFFYCIRKICHIEKWSYPVFYCKDGMSAEKLTTGNTNVKRLLHIEIAESDSNIGMCKTSELLVDIVAFSTAARILVTECSECNLPPVKDFQLEEELAF